MKDILRALSVSFMLMFSQNLFAIQGNLQSSSGFVASTVGGATVAQFTNEFDAVIDNPALMSQTKTAPGTHRFSLGLEYASYPNSFQIKPIGAYEKGKLDTAWIPFIGYFYNINDKWKFGTGFFAIGGTGYDYADSVYAQKGTYAAASIPLAVSYKASEEFSVGLSLNLVLTTLTSNNGKNKDTDASALSATPAVGVSYALSSTWLLGADLSLGTTNTYKDFYVPTAGATPSSMKIGTPLQFAIGIGNNTGKYSYGFKYRLVNWKNTENYKQLGWKDQHTFSLGGQYNLTDSWIGRAGIYYVTSVYGEKSDVNGDETVEYQGIQTTKFSRDAINAMLYGIPQMQFALGMGYKFNPNSILDYGIIYEPEAEVKFTGTSTLTGAYEILKKNSNLQIFATYTHTI